MEAAQRMANMAEGLSTVFFVNNSSPFGGELVEDIVRAPGKPIPAATVLRVARVVLEDPRATNTRAARASMAQRELTCAG
jgi:hypothetical protein